MTDEQQAEVLRDPAYALLQLGEATDMISNAFLPAPVSEADVQRLGDLIARLWSIARNAPIKSEAA